MAALEFLETNGIDTSRLPELGMYDALIRVADHEMNRQELGQYLLDTLAR